MNVSYFKEKLEKEKEKLLRKKAFYESEDPVKDEQIESSYSFDDDTSEIEGHDRIVATTEETEGYIKDIEDALEKIEKGVYGTCEKNKEIIPEARLEVYPAARYCIKCQKY